MESGVRDYGLFMENLTKQEIQSILSIEDVDLRNKMFIMKMKKYAMYSLGQLEAKDRKIVYELLTASSMPGISK